ncbi:unnamed protein product [Plutella xylostella]|uniref:(diamondback moth) hypothetical protein n=1 Tax=Plutella xylostella TaxID=51655 RepID=A0A8S4DJJ2_PLUXY|nr:unnamed protein product [Plutella xylostella]
MINANRRNAQIRRTVIIASNQKNTQSDEIDIQEQLCLSGDTNNFDEKENNQETNKIKPPDEPCSSKVSYEISYDVNEKEIRSFHIQGRRVVEIEYFFKQLQDIGSHSSMFDCNLSNIKIVNEEKAGLNSTFNMICQMCGAKFQVKSSKASESKMDIN